MYDFWDIVKIILCVLLIIAGVMGSVAGGSYYFDKTACNRYMAMNPSYQFRYDFLAGGCYINWDGMWIHASHIQIVNGSIQISE